MTRYGDRRRHAGLLLTAMFLLTACAGRSDPDSDVEQAINIPPANYKPDIVSAMHAYLRDPTGIRDAGLSDPALKLIGRDMRYVACVRFNGKGSGNAYAGMKEVAAIFIAGRFDRFQEPAREPCAGVVYAPFPELERIAR
jgi:hypothetical protein